jgi:hypothetical protein
MQGPVRHVGFGPICLRIVDCADIRPAPRGRQLQRSSAMRRTLILAATASLCCGLAAPGWAEMMKLQQCRYDAPALTTCSGLMDQSLFPYTDDKLCARRHPGYVILAYAGGMNKYAVEIRRFGSNTPIYRIGTGGFRNADYSFRFEGALHLVGNGMMLVIRHARNTAVEVWKQSSCRMVDVDPEKLETEAAKQGTGH